MICPICIGTTIATYGIPIASGVVSGYVAARIVNVSKAPGCRNGRNGSVERNNNTTNVSYYLKNNERKT